MRANLQNYPAAKARQGEIVLKRPWQRAIFLWYWRHNIIAAGYPLYLWPGR